METAPACPRSSTRAWVRGAIAYVVPASVVLFGWLGSTDVVSMEGIVADGARCMQRSGQYLVPHLFNEMYNYKPPMVYWLADAAERLTGVRNEWTLRLPVAGSALVLGLAVFITVGRLISPSRGWVCGLACVTAYIVAQKARIAEFDMPLAAGTGIAICCACMNLVRQRDSWAVWILAYLALTFGFLCKGIPALMVFGPGLLIACWRLKRFSSLFRPQHLAGVAVFVVLIGVYMNAVYQQWGWTAFQQAFSEAGARGSAWSPLALLVSLAKPLIVVAIFLPWTPLLILAFDRHWHAAESVDARRLLVVAASFAAGGVATFMIVPTHETRYYVPLCTSLGILTGLIATAAPIGVQRWDQARDLIARLTALGCGAAALVGGIIALRKSLVAADAPATLPMSVALTAVGAAAVLLASVVLRSAALRRPAALLVAAGLCAWGFNALNNVPRRAASRSLRDVAAAFAPHVPADARVWVDFDDDHSSLIYYLDRDAKWFVRSKGWPQAGRLVILFRQDKVVDQYAELEALLGRPVDALASGECKDWTFWLIRMPELPASRATSG